MCSVNECDRDVQARGLCYVHYARWRRNGTTDKVRRSGRATCSVQDCALPVHGKGWCSKHYTLTARNGSPVSVRNQSKTVECARVGCSNDVTWHQSTGRKFCSAECFHATPRPKYNYGDRFCEHCGMTYRATGPMQRFCPSCIGPTVYSKGGFSRSLGGVRLKKYGVTHAKWVEMISRYDGQCWICRVKPAAVLDHCHATGRARGALCQGCNSQLGGVERHGWLEKALNYLDELVMT